MSDVNNLFWMFLGVLFLGSMGFTLWGFLQYRKEASLPVEGPLPEGFILLRDVPVWGQSLFRSSQYDQVSFQSRGDDFAAILDTVRIFNGLLVVDSANDIKDVGRLMVRLDTLPANVQNVIRSADKDTVGVDFNENLLICCGHFVWVHRLVVEKLPDMKLLLNKSVPAGQVLLKTLPSRVKSELRKASKPNSSTVIGIGQDLLVITKWGNFFNAERVVTQVDWTRRNSITFKELPEAVQKEINSHDRKTLSNVTGLDLLIWRDKAAFYKGMLVTDFK